MFNWFENINISYYTDLIRLRFENIPINSWAKYNMPAALWLGSYLLIIDAIWESSTFRIPYLVFCYSLPVIAILSEVLQLVHIIPGTFDILDIISYSLITIIYLIFKRIL